MLAAAFLSGFAALLYELSWVRQLVLLFGVNYFAITTILFTFMTGIAAGSVVAGRLVDRWRFQPLLVFAALELFLAMYSHLIVPLRISAEDLYLCLVGDSDLSFMSHTAIRFLVGNIILLPPTLASGATLPVLGKMFVRGDDEIGRGFSKIYGANVLGAAAGTFATTFFLIGLFGYTVTARIGSLANMSAALLALGPFLLGRVTWRTPVIKTGRPWLASARAVQSASFVIGFTSLALEVLWTRIFSQYGPNPSTYIFAVIVGTFLIGHAAGSGLFFPFLVRRLTPRFGPAALFAFVQALMGVCILVSLLFLSFRSSVLEPAAFLQGIGLTLPRERIWILLPAIIFPAVCSGVLFPLANQLSIGRISNMGTGVGTLSALSTLGGILGSFLTGFCLISALGIVRCLIVLGAVNCAVASWVVYDQNRRNGRHPRARLALSGLAIGALLLHLICSAEPWSYLLLFPGEKVIAFSEGRSDSTAVIDHPCGSRLMLVCGERLLGGGSDVGLALQFNGDAKRAAIIGVGTGSVTAQALAQKSLQEVVAIDIDGELTGLMPYMIGPDFNRFVAPRFRFVEDDGRHYLLTHSEKFDLIVNDAAMYAWYLELSTLEFNRLVLSRLAPGGLYIGRLHPHRITEEALREEIATFCAVFPNAAYWQLNPHITMLIGCNGNTRLNAIKKFGRSGTAKLIGDAAALQRKAAGARLIVDDRPLHIPDAFLQKTSFPIFEYTPPERLPGGGRVKTLGNGS
jgi:predicted membrane-bound spermidine synthase